VFSYVNANPLRYNDPRGLEVLDAINKAIVDKTSGLGIGGELQCVVGGGYNSTYCCDENNNYWRVRTVKVCFGAGFAISGDASVTPTKRHRKNCPDGVGGFAAEFAAGPFGIDLSISGDKLIPSGSVGVGPGGKATVCYHFVIRKEIMGCCK